MPELFDSIQLRELVLPNRIIISPMCQYSAIEGNATDWHTVHLGSLALGGAGLVFVEATAVTPEGRITPSCLGLWNDENEAALAPVIGALRATSTSKLAIQLAHAGRKASSAVPWKGGELLRPDQGGWVPEAPSAVAYKTGEPAPRAMSRADLEQVKQAFVQAARRAVRLGFDAIEIHGAHGYLLHEFLSPLSNHRDDEYGGSLENRMRYPLEVHAAVRAAVPQGIPVGLRISATDWVDDAPSWDLDQSIELARRMQSEGLDWIDVSSGGMSPRQQIKLGPGYQVAFAEAIKRATGVATMAVGLITEPAQAQDIVARGRADMVALARGMLYDPRWPWHAAAALGRKVTAPAQYWRSVPAGVGRIFGDTVFGSR